MKEGYILEFELKGLPKLPNALMRAGWRVVSRESNKWKGKVLTMALGKKPKEPLAKAKITFTRFSSQRPDHDGLVSSFKAVQDGLRLAQIIVDDKHAVIGTPEYRWEKINPKFGKISIKVEEVR